MMAIGCHHRYVVMARWEAEAWGRLPRQAPRAESASPVEAFAETRCHSDHVHDALSILVLSVMPMACIPASAASRRLGSEASQLAITA